MTLILSHCFDFMVVLSVFFIFSTNGRAQNRDCPNTGIGLSYAEEKELLFESKIPSNLLKNMSIEKIKIKLSQIEILKKILGGYNKSLSDLERNLKDLSKYMTELKEVSETRKKLLLERDQLGFMQSKREINISLTGLESKLKELLMKRDSLLEIRGVNDIFNTEQSGLLNVDKLSTDASGVSLNLSDNGNYAIVDPLTMLLICPENLRSPSAITIIKDGIPTLMNMLVTESPGSVTGNIYLSASYRSLARLALNDKVQIKCFDHEITPASSALFKLAPFIQKKSESTETGSKLNIDFDKIKNLIATKYQDYVFATNSKILVKTADVLIDDSEIVTGANNKYLELTFIGDMKKTSTAQEIPANTPVKMTNATNIIISEDTSSILLVNASVSEPVGHTGHNGLKKKEIDFENLGIGGLGPQVERIYRNVVVPRMIPAEKRKELGIVPIKGIILWGPPGTGKTRIARILAKDVLDAEFKVINGPELFDKYVGGSEEKLREVFKDAIKDFENGKKDKTRPARLHVIVFDEIDSLFPKRGSSGDSTGTKSTMVNQMLTMMDGVDSPDNIVVIGTTNRPELLDDALKRPGRFEEMIEVGLPDEHGRFEVFMVHTKNLRSSDRLLTDEGTKDIESIKRMMEQLAQQTSNYSGAEIEAVVRKAVFNALSPHYDLKKLKEFPDFSKINITVTMNDFKKAIQEIKPAFGQNDKLELPEQIYDYPSFVNSLDQGAEFIKKFKRNKLSTMSLLVSGSPGSGKSTVAASLCKQFTFCNKISANELLELPENQWVGKIKTLIEEARRVGGAVVLEDVERLTKYCQIGRQAHCSPNLTLAMQEILGNSPVKGKKVMIIGTSSHPEWIKEELGLNFTNNLEVSDLTAEDLISLNKSKVANGMIIGEQVMTSEDDYPRTIKEYLENDLSPEEN